MVIYLYLDESGTLKLAKGPANYFVMAVLRIAEPASLRQTIERARRHALPSRLKRLPEIKASLASDQFRGLVYRGLARLALGLPGNAHLEVYHRDSTTDWGVQAADLVCWALYQKYQYGNTGWYEMIEAQIKTERLLFEPK